MALEKALIETNDGAKIKVLFNPTQYSLDRSNSIAEIGVPGLGAPVLQFVRGNSSSLTMDLFFDTYEAQSNVADLTDRIYGLLTIKEAKKPPPICTFSWANFSFKALVERVSGRFTMFLGNGTPVRATLSVTFKEYVDGSSSASAGKARSASVASALPVKAGDSLSGIAAASMGSAAAWRSIAKANAIDNPRALAAGQSLTIPPVK